MLIRRAEPRRVSVGASAAAGGAQAKGSGGAGEGEGGAKDLLAIMNANLRAGLRMAVDASCRRAWDEYGAQLSGARSGLRVAMSEVVDCEEENRILGELSSQTKKTKSINWLMTLIHCFDWN